jgi:multidrug transporter EmrE-like cation transporter
MKIFPSSPLWLIAISVVLNTLAQILLKQGVGKVGGETLWMWVWGCGHTPFIWGGVACYGTSLLFWLLALTKVEMSYGVPLLSLGYVLTTLAGALFFKEGLSVWRLVGLGLIMGGIYCVTRTSPN